jgi:hypothetical protein
MYITYDQRAQSAAAKAPPPPPSTEGTVTHTVKSGETVGELSERYGVSEKQILAANPQVRHPDDLSDGQEISTPVADNGGQTPAQTQVHPGDTLNVAGVVGRPTQTRGLTRSDFCVWGWVPGALDNQGKCGGAAEPASGNRSA